MSRIAAVRRWEGWREPRWALGAAFGALAIAFLVSVRPWLAAGATIGGLLLVLLLTRPLALIGGMLAVGAVDLSFVTGGRRSLFDALGGLDMNGIRLVGLVAGIVLLLVIDRRLHRWAFGPLGRWYLLFLAFAAATLFISPSRIEGLRLLFKLAYPFLMFVAVCGLVRTRAELDRLGDWVLVAAAVLVLIVNPLLVLSGGYIVDARGYLRVQGLGLGQSAFSFYVLAMLLFSFARYAARGQLRYLALGAVLAAWIVPTLTRTTLGGALAGLGGAALYAALVGRNYRAIVGATLLAATVAVPLMPLALERTFGYIPSLGDLWTLAQDPAALYGRIYWTGRDVIWAVIFAAYRSSPIIGLGLGGSSALLLHDVPSDWADVAHNEYLRLLADTGIVGLALFAIAVATWWIASVRAGRTGDGLAREYAMPAFAGIVAWAVISFPGNAFDYYAQYTQYMGFFVAGAVTAVRLARESTASDDEDVPDGASLDVDVEGRDVRAG